ncbi:uncharacterized protein BDFB_005388 [Asbolus verrucosus]|uniref:MADF domain-containing protein n=1 Tax=Asbolus verrucosus TaxID=1661398 RepID=A0A482VBR8_ASBVE|nr:uncharacterized protein BDFB_005388 [Asbolus verrucosus]
MPLMDNTSQRGPEWTCNEVMQLIKEYGQRPALWNPECDNYKNKYKKHQDWMELAAIFKCNKLEVERKMKILNSQYRRERLKAMKLRKAGLPHRITWYGYKSFSFLNKNFKMKRNVNTIKEEPSEEEHNYENLTAVSSDLTYVNSKNSESHTQSDLLATYINNNEAYGTIEENKESENTSQVNNAANETHSGYERDEWIVFGELIAHGLRKLPDERTKCIVKYKINTILYEAELSSYK